MSKKRSRKKTIRKEDNAIKRDDAFFENPPQQIGLGYNDCLNR